MHKHLKIEKVLKIQVWLTPQEWSLYDMFAANVVSHALNSTLTTYVNRGETRERVTEMMLSVMRDYEDYGARDTAVREVLEYLLDEIFKVR